MKIEEAIKMGEYVILKNLVGLLTITSFSTGLLLLACPKESLKRLNDFFNTWFSLRKLLKPLETLRNVDTQIYKRTKILGVLILIVIPILIRCYIRL